MSRLREGHELAVTPGGDAVTETSSRASGSDCEICYHGCNPRQLSQILQRGLLPKKVSRISLRSGARRTSTRLWDIRWL